MTPDQRAKAERLADWLAACGVVNIEVRATVALLRELAAEPQGEPVARIHVWSKISRFTGQPECHAELVNFEDGVETLPEGGHVLYAHPPQRQPLTEDQVWADDGIMSANAGAQLLMPCLMELVRAVERKHRIWESP